MLVDRESGEPLTDKVHILLCSLKKVPKKWEECRTEMECILFLIKNMELMDNTSLAYREGRFAEIFEAARSNRLREDEKIAYSQSLEKLRDTQAGIRFAADKAREEGEAKGRAEGEAMGIHAAMTKVARKMKADGSPIEKIAAITELSIEEIENL